MKYKVGIIVGTRPEAIKLIPVYNQLKLSKKIQPILISTGQHKEMLYQVLDFFDLRPDHDLKVMQPDQTLASLTSRIIERTDDLLKKLKLDLIIVQGDTTTAFACSLSAFYSKIPVAHVEAGLRTQDIYSPFPEEINRKLIGSIAAFNFAPTADAVKNLQKENIKGIHRVGNTVVDASLLCLKKIKSSENSYREFFRNEIGTCPRYCLITGHRRESFGQGLVNICNAISALATRYPDIGFIYPIHLNPNVKKTVHKYLAGKENIHLLDAMPYDRLIYVMSRSHIILTDSGGIQEEAPTFHVPVIVMRDKTERNEGIRAGCAVLAGTSTKNIIQKFNDIMTHTPTYRKMANAKNPYGDGNASKKIVAILERSLA